ncbi:GntR family transcriptional regulator [Streptomyces thermoalcalitolerans]|uniref:HTH gntR-type domain-containing protein n=1 Tax=Streptomyces thermoalcalitolerans TaxID=65605 RepID=A0ABN1NFL9_9ACTN
MEFEPDIPRWRQVAAVIRSRIEEGVYPPRGRVPSVQQLVEEFGIATATAQKVNVGLKREGLVYTEPGMGSFVSRDALEILRKARAAAEAEAAD